VDLSGFEVRGLALGAAARAELLAIATRRAAPDLATAAMLRKVFRRRPPASLIAPWDGEPHGRLTVSLAREAGVRTLVLAHGAFLLPQTLADMEVCDEPLLWSEAVAPPIADRDRPIHVVGYPMPHMRPPPTRPAPRGPRRRVLVLGQPTLSGTLLDDPRITMRQYDVAVRAVLDRCPSATLVLRPHPAEGPDAAAAIVARFRALDFEIDRATPIADALAACDLCIGTITTATLQAALVGTPVVALNLTRFEWRWPLGGDTTVPVARDQRQLADWLARWEAGGPLPGRDDLLGALGASVEGADPTASILAVVAGEGAPASG
ncbi:MAG: hypothetical protein Q8O56_17180, partial [Solirubrobacteraceae bacterium]|nr:hypothetical protein [Solirubrobacteraceae bacterium]